VPARLDAIKAIPSGSCRPWIAMHAGSSQSSTHRCGEIQGPLSSTSAAVRQKGIPSLCPGGVTRLLPTHGTSQCARFVLINAVGRAFGLAADSVLANTQRAEIDHNSLCECSTRYVAACISQSDSAIVVRLHSAAANSLNKVTTSPSSSYCA
jgi:hypothetical protein